MRLQARSWRSATSALLPVATAALAAGILIVDILTPPEFVVAMLYVAVVLMAARFCRPPGVVLVAAGCVGLTVLSYFLSAETAINTAISIAAIGATTFLALQSQSTEAVLREQASLLDLTHDSIVARRFDDDVITYWSRGAEELYGWHRAEAVGRVGSELRKTAVPLPLDQIKAELLPAGPKQLRLDLIERQRNSGLPEFGTDPTHRFGAVPAVQFLGAATPIRDHIIVEAAGDDGIMCQIEEAGLLAQHGFRGLALQREKGCRPDCCDADSRIDGSLG